MAQSPHKMKMKVTQISPNQMNEWDRFVKGHPHGSIYHQSGWKKVLEQSFRQIKGTILVVRDAASDSIIAGLPIYSVKSWITGNRLVSIPLAWQGTPLVSSRQEMNMLMEHLLEQFHQERASYIEIRALPSSPITLTNRLEPTYLYKHHYIILDRDPEILMQRFHKKSVRIQLGKSFKAGLVIEHGQSVDDLKIFYDIFIKSRKRLGLPALPYAFFKSQWDIFSLEEQIKVLLARYEGKAVGAVVLLKYRDAMMGEYDTAIGGFHKLRVSPFLFWESIKIAYYEGCREFSFGRTSINQKGLLRYKDRWGTQSEMLPSFYFPAVTNGKNRSNITSLKYTLTRSVLKNSPAPLFKMFSHFISHHMG